MKSVMKLDRAGALVSVTLLVIVSAAVVVQGQSKDAKRVAEATKEAQKAADVFTEIMSAPDKGIPQEVLEKAQCIGMTQADAMKNGCACI